MGLLDTERRDSTVDRHDHNTVYEGNVSARRANNTQLVVVAILVIFLLVLVVFVTKIAVNKCVKKIIRAVRREVAQPTAASA